MTDPKLGGLSLILSTNAEVDQAANLLQAIGLTITGSDGYYEVTGPAITISIMRGAMVEVPPLGGTLLQITVPDVPSAVNAAEAAGATVALAPTKTDWGSFSAFVQSPFGFTVELQSPTTDGQTAP